jgi:hypothetical protein
MVVGVLFLIAVILSMKLFQNKSINTLFQRYVAGFSRYVVQTVSEVVATYATLFFVDVEVAQRQNCNNEDKNNAYQTIVTCVSHDAYCNIAFVGIGKYCIGSR